MPVQQLRVIQDCYVTDSSGCHRYDFWNEQHLFDGSPHTGWGSLSRNEPHPEYLEIDLGEIRVPVKIRLQRRPVPVIRTGFPGSLHVIAYPEQGGEKTLLSAEGISADAGEWWEGDLEPVATRRIRVETGGVEIRPSGKYFTQIMQIQLLES
ncbi:discoidin domain-containing protein [Streptomyces pinistramenti]|uniref:discoidin domain-containing protein n=1 Tax=Streptomyces pinistramenti TaxID=2884812 RepID=UPI001D085341|nr:discoidin domain-containing protein [Streptomyces pinistramenti]MCB5910433.1 discoidin domain-containing protein [Streptomyces pinistramenti]